MSFMLHSFGACQLQLCDHASCCVMMAACDFLSLSLMTKLSFVQVSCSIRNMSGQDSDPDSILFSPSDEEQVSFDSILRTPEEVDRPLAQDSDARDNGWLSSGGSHDRISVQHSIPLSSTCSSG